MNSRSDYNVSSKLICVCLAIRLLNSHWMILTFNSISFHPFSLTDMNVCGDAIALLTVDMMCALCLCELLSSFDNQPFEELCGWIKAQHNPSAKCDIFVHHTNNTKNYTQENNTAVYTEMKCLFNSGRLSLCSSSLVTFNPFGQKQST